MLYAADFRKIARNALTGKWTLALATGFIAVLLGGTSTSINFSASGVRERFTYRLDADWNIILPMMAGITTIISLYLILILIIGGAVKLGYCRFNKNIIDNNNPQFTDLFSRFDMFGKGFLMQLLMGIYTFLWTLLFVIPGIIAAYSYAMTAYILEENPEMSANEAIGHSKEMMRGNKWRLFCLEISFIGWAILCLFTCGLGFLWLIPYQNAARAAFFYEVSGKYLNQNWRQEGMWDNNNIPIE